MKKAVFIVIIVMLFLSANIVAEAQEQVYGHLLVDNIFVIIDENHKAKAMFPDTIEIIYDYYYVVNSQASPDTDYIVEEKRIDWAGQYYIPETMYIPELDAYITLKYNMSLELKQEKGEYNQNQYYGVGVHARVKFEVSFKGYPEISYQLDLGDILRRYFFRGWDPYINFYVKIRREVNGQFTGYITIYKLLQLSLDNLIVTFYTVYIDITKISLEKYILISETNTWSLQPQYTIKTCGKILESNNIIGGIINIMGVEEEIELKNRLQCRDISNVQLIPGENVTLSAGFKTGAYSFTINKTVNISGAVLTITTPSGSVTGTPGDWHLSFSIPVSANMYRISNPFKISGKVIVEGLGVVPCKNITVAQAGSYLIRCTKTFQTNWGTPEFASSIYTLQLTIVDELGVKHDLTAQFTPKVFDPSNIADTSFTIYNWAQSMLTSGIALALILLAISFILEHSGRTILDRSFLLSSIMALILGLLILQVGIPFIYNFFSNLLASSPIFQKYVSPPPSNLPTSESFRYFIEYYDKLFNKIEEDYQSVFISSVNSIFSSINNLIYGFILAFGVALALSFWAGASISWGTLAGTFLGIIFTYLSLIIMFAPMGAIIVAAVSIARMFVLLLSIIVVVVFALGVILIALPVPFARALGEEFFGAGLLYFIVFPLLGPVLYALYNYVLETALSSISGGIAISLGAVNFVIPVKAIATILVYNVASGMSLIFLLIGLSNILRRTGIGAGIGEALSTIVWR